MIYEIKNNQVFINGEQIKTPKRMNTNNQTIVNGKIYIGGYEYIKEKKEFKRTLTAIWHLLF